MPSEVGIYEKHICGSRDQPPDVSNVPVDCGKENRFLSSIDFIIGAETGDTVYELG
jgi:hypothetical protein